MPTYEYECGNCNEHVEYFQSMTESPKRKCPKCGRLKLKRLLGTGAGIIFKGSGFYCTDYRSDSYQQSAKKEKSDSTSSSSSDSSSSKSDAKESGKSKASGKKGDLKKAS